MKNIGSLFYKPKKNDKGIKAKRWNLFSIIGKAIRKTCTAIGAMVLLSMILSIVLVSIFAGKSAPPLPDDMVLVLKLESNISETQARPSFMDPFPFKQPTLHHIIDALEAAKDDDRVRGLVFSLKGGSVGIAHTQELRTAIANFKESGKFTKIYASSYVDGSGGLRQYYLASVFDEIWMQPVGMFSISGMNMEMPFARKALDKLGVRAQFFQREEFKSAMENFTNSEISPANKKAMQSLLGNLSARMMSDIVNDRDIDLISLGLQVDKGILTGKEALEAKLLDRLDYADVMVSEIRKEATGDPEDESLELISLGRYAQAVEKINSSASASKDKINVALIYAVGTIVDSAGARGNAGASEISAAIAEAYNDDDIEAIVLRVDSPGGSPSASETIRRALVKAKEKGKKVIVSMGPLAASGGYWISADADIIFASPGTITGSIGVVMGKFEASKLWEKLGIHWDGVQMGANADIWSMNKPFDDDANARMNVLIDDVYDAFITIVAEGRHLTSAQVKQVAKGRAWTGEQGKLNGLVDELGGLNAALDKTSTMFDGVDRHDLNIVHLPRELNKIEQLLEIFGQQVSLGHFMKTQSKWIEKVQSIMGQIDTVQHASEYTVYNADLEALR